MTTRDRSDLRGRICIVTPAHIAMHPRVVKEADTLSAGGHQVTVCASQYDPWATDADETILQRAAWRAELLQCGRRSAAPLFWRSRVRQRLSRYLLSALRWPGANGRGEAVALRAYHPVLPEFAAIVARRSADLYIAHDVHALPVVVAAARRHGARVGLDAEDFYSARSAEGDTPSLTERIRRFLERRYLASCDYVIASSEAIARAYADKYGIPPPPVILNVFPLSQRPETFRRGEPGDPVRLYWFSATIGARRGLEDAVRAMGLVRHLPLELHLRGRWQSGYRERLLALGHAVGLRPGQIIIHPPTYPHTMVAMASRYDVGLALEPGQAENNRLAASNKLFAYLLAGNAIVATATDGQRAVLDRLGEAACVYQPGDAAAFARRLQTWCEERSSLERARRAAWDWGAREYNWDRESTKLVDVVEAALRPEARGLSDPEGIRAPSRSAPGRTFA